MTLHGFYTDRGRALAAKITAGTAAFTVTRIVAGSGYTGDIPSAVSLPDIRQTLTVGSAVVNGSTAVLPVTLVEASASASYSLTELGVYAADPDAGEILFQVFRLDAAAGITAGGEGVLRFYLRQSIGAQGVTVNCAATGVLIEGDLQPLWDAVARKPDALLDSKTLHVAKTGSDTTGDGSESKPYLTIRHALDTLPRVLMHNATIAIHEGTYDEALYCTYLTGGGSLMLMGVAGETVNITTLQFYSCTCLIALKNLHLVGSHSWGFSLYVQQCPNVYVDELQCTNEVTSQDYGTVLVTDGSLVRIRDTTVTNKQIALDVSASVVYLAPSVVLSGTVANRVGSGWSGSYGGITVKGSASVTGTEQKSNGGQIW